MIAIILITGLVVLVHKPGLWFIRIHSPWLLLFGSNTWSIWYTSRNCRQERSCCYETWSPV